MFPLFLLLLSLLALSQASYNIPGINSCQFLTRFEGVEQKKFKHELHIVVDDTVDIHEAALVFQRLMCLLRGHFFPSDSIEGIPLWFLTAGRYKFGYSGSDDAYDFFVRYLGKQRTPRKDMCSVRRSNTEKMLIFTEYKGIHCPDTQSNRTSIIVLDRWYNFPDLKREANRYQIDVRKEDSIRSIYDLAFRLADTPINPMLVRVDTVSKKRPDEDKRDKPNKTESFRVLVGLFYLGGLLILIFILFLSLLNLVNVNEHYLYVLHQLIRQRVRRQRARMADNGENGEEEDGEEAAEQGPRRRNRLNSEELSLLGTDENTIRTALSGRFTSLSSLSFHSAESRPRRNSLVSLDEVVVEPSDDVNEERKVEHKEEEKKSQNK